MSGAAQPNSQSTKANASASTDATKPLQSTKPAAQLEEDDEFEDFPVEDWAKQEEVGAQQASTSHLWEESWDDDDTSDDFSVQLKEELKKMEAGKR
nr:putative 26s proteasome complex subunit sem-1 [Quercus suber]